MWYESAAIPAVWVSPRCQSSGCVIDCMPRPTSSIAGVAEHRRQRLVDVDQRRRCRRSTSAMPVGAPWKASAESLLGEIEIVRLAQAGW